MTGPSWSEPHLREFFRRRPPLWTEAIAAGWLLWVYDAIDNLAPVRAGSALRHTTMARRLERHLDIKFESALNRGVSAHHLLGLILSDYYDNAHFIVTLGLLAWLWLARPEQYRSWRRALVGINLAGFAVFWFYPMAPPRMLHGFVDTVAVTHAVGSWHTGSLSAAANQYAAMPSLHMGWAVWAAMVTWRTMLSRQARTAAVLHPALTLLAVLSTANHLLIDSLAGVATAAICSRADGLIVRSLGPALAAPAREELNPASAASRSHGHEGALRSSGRGSKVGTG